MEAPEKIFSGWMHKKRHISPLVPHILICKSAFRWREFSETGGRDMNEETNSILTLPDRPAPKGDLDDLIFRGEGWLASDR